LACAQCGISFLGTRYKQLRAKRGFDVFCTRVCSNARNLVAAFAARGLDYEKCKHRDSHK
jgi:hypothetical protein